MPDDPLDSGDPELWAAELARLEVLEARQKVQLETTRLRIMLARQVIAQGRNRTAMGREGLLRPISGRTISHNMAQTQEDTKPRRRGRPTMSEHAFPRALEAAGTNVTEWAKKHKLEREMVKSWFAPGVHGRRIPRRWAEAIAREFSLPATDEVWTNGIR